MVIHLLFVFLTADASVLYRDCQKFIIINKDFSSYVQEKKEWIILNHMGREKYGNVTIPYIKGKEIIEELRCFTVTENGDTLRPPSKAVGDLSSFTAALAPDFRNFRVKSVVYPSVKEGSELHLFYRKKKKGDDNIFGAEIFKSKNPVLHKELIVKSPVKLNYMVKGKIHSEEEITEDGFFLYKFYKDSVPGIDEEPYMEPWDNGIEVVYYSSFDRWEQVVEFLRDRLKGKEKINSKIKRIVKNLKSRGDVMKSIYGYVSGEISEVDIGLKRMEFSPSSVKDIFNRKYGPLTDKSLLLLAMLREAGIKAYPCFVAHSIIKSFPTLSYFYKMIVAVERDNKFIFISPEKYPGSELTVNINGIMEGNINEDIPLSPDIAGEEVLILKDKGFIFSRIPEPIPSFNKSKMEFRGTLSSEGTFTGSISLEISPSISGGIKRKFSSMKKRCQEDYIEQIIYRMGTRGQIKDWQLGNLNDIFSPFILNITFLINDYSTKMEDGRIKIPLPGFIFFDPIEYFIIEDRKYNLDISIPISGMLKCNIKFPEEYRIFYKPEDINVETPFVKVNINTLIGKGEVTIIKEYEFKKSIYTPDEYRDVKKIIERFNLPSNAFIIIEKS